MSATRRTTSDTGQGRCEVCRVVLHERPDPRRRRCVDHLDQLALVPLTAVPGRRSGRRRMSTTTTSNGRKGGDPR